MNSLPSPASSPEPPALDAPPSRKRQRSVSMQSDTSSSSAKRSVSEGATPDTPVRSPRTDQLSTLSLSDQSTDIDAYMAAQGESDIPAAIALPAAPSALDQPPAMSGPERYSFVDKGKSRQMEVGDTWYLVSRDWWKRWKKACTGEIDKEGPVDEADLGPVDNARLLDAYGNLLPSLAEGVDVEFVPHEIWSCLMSWYGESTSPLPRRVVARGAAKEVALELRPPRLKVLRLTKAQCNGASEDPPHPWLFISAGESISALCTRLADLVSPSTTQNHPPYRVWKLDSGYDDWSYAKYPASQLSAAGGKIIEESPQTLEEAGVVSEDAFVVEFKEADGWLAEVPPKTPAKAPSPPLSDYGPPPLFSSENAFFNKLGASSSKTTTGLSTGFKPSSSSSLLGSNWLGKSNALSLTGSSNKGFTKALEPGTLGLGNMGNTCFMNSALQCLAHTEELTEYFLNGVYQEELNPDNPLGMHGAIAEAFGDLLQRIWATSGSSNSYTPREFKSQLQTFAPQFTGYQQHDSQELVAFLLDGLHEDLNRVLKKPYVEKPDWEGGGDVELVKLAQKSWEGYMMRNDSVIVDLFQGQYQSTLVCPECKKVSITFDPFMYLTLPLPVQKMWKHMIYYIPWDNEKPHVKVPVEINRDASFRDLRVLLGKWMGAPADNLLTMEIFSHRFYKNLDDNHPCGEMADNDIIVCYELPCHAQQSRTYKKEDGDPFIIPVFLTEAKPAVRTLYNKSTQPFGYPTVVVITQEQAKSVSAMYDAVIDRLARWTAHARDLYTWEPGSEYPVDEVPIRLNGFPPIESMTEILENGEIITHEETPAEEGDIVDEKSMVAVVDEDAMDFTPISAAPRVVGAKPGVFTLLLQAGHKQFAPTAGSYGPDRWETWDRREADADANPVLLREGDAFFCDFDENTKAYYFGDTASSYEYAKWNNWDEFVHPEYTAGKKEHAQKSSRGISLQDCLDEFTKEEKLGEDDLWYCPRCKKHQQATKRFDLWKAPDVLVVHLKRFSNSRALRDKIDTFIDFPVEGLDLGDMIGERAVAKRLLEQGVPVDELNLGSVDEPLVYDLFAVDEHMGGLGGGHYRAYAANHQTGKWYHFDDSHVSPARPTDAVNANAYLLFYRRRSTTPLGGKTHIKIEEARRKLKVEPVPEPSVTLGTQLPTPPNELSLEEERLPRLASSSPVLRTDRWTLRSGGSTAGSSTSPPPDDPPNFEDSLSDPLVEENLDYLTTDRYSFPDPSSTKPSPTSSNEADFGQDNEDDFITGPYTVVEEVAREDSPDWDRVNSSMHSPSSSTSDINPFADANVQRLGVKRLTEEEAAALIRGGQ